VRGRRGRGADAKEGPGRLGFLWPRDFRPEVEDAPDRWGPPGSVRSKREKAVRGTQAEFGWASLARLALFFFFVYFSLFFFFKFVS
jgi:hypothetical protein